MLTAHRLFRDEHLLLLSFYLLNFLMQRICVARILHGWENIARMFILSVCILVRKHFRLSQMNHRYMATCSTNLVNRQPIINVFFLCIPEPISIQWQIQNMCFFGVDFNVGTTKNHFVCFVLPIVGLLSWLTYQNDDNYICLCHRLKI